MSYHDRIMNISAESLHEDTLGQSMAYRRGQRDARHIAAEIANEADAEIERLKADLDRLHRERDSFQEQCRVMAEENAKLESALREFAKANSWQNFGDCRSFGDGEILPPHKLHSLAEELLK